MHAAILHTGLTDIKKKPELVYRQALKRNPIVEKKKKKRSVGAASVGCCGDQRAVCGRIGRIQEHKPAEEEEEKKPQRKDNAGFYLQNECSVIGDAA